MSAAKKSIVVGLSGGVDSSVTAILLQESGHDVQAVFMKNWHDEDNHCSLEQDEKDVRAICETRQIPLTVLNLTQDYEEKVFQIMLDELARGLTPNPDILCNQEIKFATLLHYVTEQGADYLATGHYAALCSYHNRIALAQASDHNKDQTYFLSRMPSSALSRVLFPLGRKTKAQVRALAEKYQLVNAKKKDSTGICFIGKRKYQDFISQYLLDKPGDIINEQGHILGQHRGLFYYTIGQRKGLEIGGRQGDIEAPWFVIRKDLDKNNIIVAQGTNNPELYQTKLEGCNLEWHQPPSQKHFHCLASIRHRQTPVPCTVTLQDEKKCLVTFDDPQRAITPGQYICLYDKTVVLGNAQILRSHP